MIEETKAFFRLERNERIFVVEGKGEIILFPFNSK